MLNLIPVRYAQKSRLAIFGVAIVKLSFDIMLHQVVAKLLPLLPFNAVDDAALLVESRVYPITDFYDNGFLHREVGVVDLAICWDGG